MKRDVTERDFRQSQFWDADPSDYEFRDDGKIVRKDRWEVGINKIRFELGMNTREFEIDDILNAVKVLMSQYPDREEEQEDD